METLLETLKNPNIIGLLLDIIGAILIFIYGITKDLNPQGHQNFILEQNDDKITDEYKKHKYWSKIGLLLLILGFIFQLIGNCKAITKD